MTSSDITFEDDGFLFKHTATKDLRNGDKVFHKTWFPHINNIVSQGLYYLVLSNDGNTIVGRHINDSFIFSWSYLTFSEGWCVMIDELQYDPNQQGDKDEDI